MHPSPDSERLGSLSLNGWSLNSGLSDSRVGATPILLPSVTYNISPNSTAFFQITCSVNMN